MTLIELLKNIFVEEIPSSLKGIQINSISSDSRKIESNSIFVALTGTTTDGVHYIDQAIKNGAKVVIFKKGVSLQTQKDILYCPVLDPMNTLKILLKKFYGNPSQKVRTIGITGTNGKTTLTYLISAILEKAKFQSAIVGTIQYKIGHQIMPSGNTTPGLVDNQRYLSEMVNQGIDYCVMEVSSHALDQGRVDLIDFREAVFTNLTSDHLDYHKTRENYFSAKAKLFENLSADATAIINIDDDAGLKLLEITKSKVLTFGVKGKADILAEDILLNEKGLQFKLKYLQGEILIRSKLFGLHNVYNILGAIAVGIAEKIDLKLIQEGIESLECVPGRLERVKEAEDFTVFIDYAHTQDALENVLNTIRKSLKTKIILVFGCGGDRDKTKRPKMAEAATRLADFSFVTSDNPRTEEPDNIIRDILPGFKNNNYKVIVKREDAIYAALEMAKPGDIVLIAGKGHETYQIFKDKTIHFDEREIVRDILKCLPSKKS